MADSTYRHFDIENIRPPIPTRSMDWEATHEDSDGAPDGWSAQLHAETREELISWIDEWHDENLEGCSEELMSAAKGALAVLDPDTDGPTKRRLENAIHAFEGSFNR